MKISRVGHEHNARTGALLTLNIFIHNIPINTMLRGKVVILLIRPFSLSIGRVFPDEKGLVKYFHNCSYNLLYVPTNRK